MPDAIKDTQQFMEASGIFGRRRTLLVGRGATALMLLYESLSNHNKRVILPAIGCPSILATALLAGLKPIIVDVDSNLNIDPAKVADVVQPGDIVLGVHIFGIPFAIDELERVCSERDAFLIEDAAQAIGGRIKGRPVGTFGHASILSFAKGKILPTNGGGAILIDDVDLYKTLRILVEKLPKRPENVDANAQEIRDILTDAFNKARRDNPQEASIWKSVYAKYPEIYYYSMEPDETGSIVRAMRDISKIAGKRRDGVEWYHRHLEKIKIDILDYPEKCSPFRFSFILPKLSGTLVQECTEAIRSEGMHASNLYLPLHWLAPDAVEDTGCPHAEMAGMRIINLWLDNGIPERDASRVTEIVNRWTN